MCLTTKNPPQIAEEDLIVYKAVYRSAEHQIRSEIQLFIYEFGRLYTEELKPESNLYLAQFYDDRACNQEIKMGIRNEFRVIIQSEDNKTISRGFHSARSASRFGSRSTIVECTIPKGSIYYEDGDELIVSNQIIINKIIWNVPDN